MAELGSVVFEGSRQRTDVRQQNDQRDVLQGIKEVGEKAIEVKTNDILGDFQEDLNQTTAEAVNADAQEAADIAKADTGNDQQNALIDRINTLKAQATASTGGTQRRVELELRKQTEQLRRRFPGLQAKIDAEFSSFKATDADFAELGLNDATSGTFNTEAAKARDAIWDEAFGDGPGKLGMDPGQFTFGDEEFAREYLWRSTRVQQQEKNAIYLQTKKSSDARQAYDNLPGLWKGLVGGPDAPLNLATQNLQRQVRGVASALRDPTAPGAPELIANWDAFGKDQALAEVQKAMLALELEFQDIPLELAGTDEYTAFKANKDAMIAGYSAYAEAIAGNSPTLLQAHETLDKVRQFNYENEHPEVVEMNTMIEAFTPLIEAVDSLGFSEQGKILGNKLSKHIDGSLTGVLSNAIAASGHITPSIPPGAAATDYMNMGQAYLANNRDRYGAINTAEGYRLGAIDATGALLSPAFVEAYRLGVSPKVASTNLASVGTYTMDLASNGQEETDAWERYKGFIANDGVLLLNAEAVKSDKPNSGKYLGAQLDTLWQNNEDRRQNAYALALGSPISPGIPFSDIYTLDTSKLEDGQVSFIVNEQLIKERVAQGRGNQFRDNTTGGENRFQGFDTDVNAERQALKKAQEVANALGQRISTDVRARGNTLALKQGVSEADYEAQWVSGSFIGFFGEADNRNSPEFLSMTAQERADHAAIIGGSGT